MEDRPSPSELGINTQKIIKARESKEKRSSQEYFPEKANVVLLDQGLVIPQDQFQSQTENPSSFGLLMTSDRTKSAFSSFYRYPAKELFSHTKAAFVEHPNDIDGTHYNFLQWKGTGETIAAKKQLIENNSFYNWSDKLESCDIIETGNQSAFRIATFKVRDIPPYSRFLGAAFYEDLLIEKRQSDKISQVTQGQLRIPKIIDTVQFSEQFAKNHNLPLPGENLTHFETRLKESGILPSQQILHFEGSDYQDASLGQNVRAFKNIIRVMDIETIVATIEKSKGTSSEVKARSDLLFMLNTSSRILAEELNQEITPASFPSTFASILGEQAGLLTQYGIIQGAMWGHKQDITLAGEICDFDTAEIISDITDPERLARKKPEMEYRTFQQIFLIAGHLKPVIDAANQLGLIKEGDEAEIANNFVQSCSIVLSNNPEMKQKILHLLNIAESEEYSGIGKINVMAERIVNNPKYTDSIKTNFAGYQPFFDQIREQFKTTLQQQNR